MSVEVLQEYILDEGVEAETEGGDRCANKNKLEISQMFHAFCIWWELVRLPLPLVSSAELLNYFLVKFNNLGIPINTKILDIFLNDGFLSLCQGIN